MSVNRPATITIGNTLYQTFIGKNGLVLKSMVDSIITIILKRLLKKPVRRYMFWLELRLTCKKKTLLMNAFFKSRFSYWLLVWMSHGRLMNNKTSRLQE